MDYISIPIILIISYIIGEIYKVIFSKKKWCKKMLPIVESITGGIVGVLIYLSNPEEFTIKVNIWTSLTIGMALGASASTSEVIKKIFKNHKNS